jgi:NAD(P)-dependent dehydrogenase (short-subunit alcohol dehydrogenase family)
VNAVAPGVTKTPMTDRVALDPQAGAAMRAIPIPHGRFGQPDEIAAVIEFLLSPDAAFVLGSIWFVDGGTDAVLQPTRL